MRWLRNPWVITVLGWMVGGCLYEGSDRCGEHQYLDNNVCVCDSGYRLNTTSNLCEPCLEHQVVRANVCVCDTGYAWDDTTQLCVIGTTGQGDACASSADCSHAESPVCILTTTPRTHETGYCSVEGCNDTTLCAGGYQCASESSPSFCARPPTGMGQTCASQADCADTAATFCDTFSSHNCAVADCTLDPNDCFYGYRCCDMSAYAAMGIPSRMCLPETMACP